MLFTKQEHAAVDSSKVCYQEKKNDVQILMFVVVLFLLTNYTQLHCV